ncbi:MAG: TSUP family transporter, partial [Actinomycetota bacterium]|nr:TSUP family transporter [Actinomycetota bacterium]
MSPAAALAVLGVGLAAGTLNTIVGSGSLITFPTLLALGYPPVVANVSNTIGLVPGSISGAIGYRR